MRDRETNLTRRRLLALGAAALASVPAAPLLLRPAMADERLSEDDPQARSLNYRHDATKADHPDYQKGQSCANCQLYTDADAEKWGPCSAFPGRKVAAGGWCSAWVPRA